MVKNYTSGRLTYPSVIANPGCMVSVRFSLRSGTHLMRVASEVRSRPRFLDKELGKITGDSRQPDRYADFLIKTRLKSGEERLLLCHIEIQGRQEWNFAERIFQYATRIYMRHGSFPASLIVLTDENPHFRPSGYTIERPGVSLEVRFNTVKLQDFRDRREELAGSGNPFACVVEAQLEVNELRKRCGRAESLDREESRGPRQAEEVNKYYGTLNERRRQRTGRLQHLRRQGDVQLCNAVFSRDCASNSSERPGWLRQKSVW